MYDKDTLYNLALITINVPSGVLKFITGLGDNLKNKLLIWNGLKMSFRTITVNRDKNCHVCGAHALSD